MPTTVFWFVWKVGFRTSGKIKKNKKQKNRPVKAFDCTVFINSVIKIWLLCDLKAV